MRRALPFYLGVAIASAILFAGNGMDAATLTTRALSSQASRALCFGSWGLAALAAAQVWLYCPAMWLLRAQPVSRAAIVTLLTAGLALAQLPWAMLWVRGAGWISGMWAVAAAAALQAGVLAASRRPAHLGNLAIALAAVALGPGPWGLALAAAACGAAVDSAWRGGVENAARGHDWILANGPLGAWSCALMAVTLRGHAPLFHRLALLGVAAAWIAIAGLQNGFGDGDLGVTRACLLVFSPVCVVGSASLAGPVLRAESEGAWLLRASGAPERVFSAPAVLLGGLAAGSGLAFAAVVSWVTPLSPLSGLGLGAAASSVGGALGIAGTCLARRALCGDGNDAARLIAGSVGSWLLAALAIVGLQVWITPLLAAMAVLVVGSWQAFRTRRRPSSAEA